MNNRQKLRGWEGLPFTQFLRMTMRMGREDKPSFAHPPTGQKFLVPELVESLSSV